MPERSQHAVVSQDYAWIGMHPDGKKGEVLSVQKHLNMG